MPQPHMGYVTQYNDAGPYMRSGKIDSFEQDLSMPPDMTSIDSDINKIGALTPFSDQFMPNIGQRQPIGF